MKATTMTKIFFALLAAGLVAYQIYKLPKFDDGEEVPTFTSTLLTGETFQLEDLRGRYVLLDFWGSWCGPCRQESPALRSTSDQFRGVQFTDADGFDIVSVAIETSDSRWKKAIEQDGLNWKYHIVQLDRFDGPIASAYGVKEIPTKYLLGTAGQVLMVNPTFEEIYQFLDKKRKNYKSLD